MWTTRNYSAYVNSGGVGSALKPFEVVVLMTDGINSDDPNIKGDPLGAIDPKMCDLIKSKAKYLIVLGTRLPAERWRIDVNSNESPGVRWGVNSAYDNRTALHNGQENCASDGMFFAAGDGAQIDAAFDEITRVLEERLESDRTVALKK